MPARKRRKPYDRETIRNFKEEGYPFHGALQAHLMDVWMHKNPDSKPIFHGYNFEPASMVLHPFYFNDRGELHFGEPYVYHKDPWQLSDYDARNEAHVYGLQSADIRRDIADAVFTKLCLTDSRIFSRN